MKQAPMVVLRCQCRRTLATITEVPDWSTTLSVPACGHCSAWTPHSILSRHRRGQKAMLTVAMHLPAEALRPAVERYLATGTTQDEVVRGINVGD
jgi:hypothetical protein